MDPLHKVSALQNKLKALHGANGALDKEADRAQTYHFSVGFVA